MDRAVKIAIEAYALTLAPGENLAGLGCPFCGNVAKSFSVKREATGILYNCYRESCKADNRSHGFLGTAGVHRPVLAKPKVKVGSPFLGDLRPLLRGEEVAIYDAYGITNENLRQNCLGVDMESGRYIMKVEGINGEERGVVARTPPGDKRKPKTIAYRNDFKHPYLAWYGPGASTLVLVEDQWSAIKLAQISDELVTAALMGTNMTQQNAMEIGAGEFNKIIIALDKDATRAAFDMRREYSLYWNCNVMVLPLPGLDIKDMASEDIKALFCGYV